MFEITMQNGTMSFSDAPKAAPQIDVSVPVNDTDSVLTVPAATKEADPVNNTIPESGAAMTEKTITNKTKE